MSTKAGAIHLAFAYAVIAEERVLTRVASLAFAPVHLLTPVGRQYIAYLPLNGKPEGVLVL